MSLILKDLKIENIKGETLFNPLNIEVNSNQTLCLMGPSGCGKSTLLDCIAGHLNNAFRYQGQMILNGVDLNTLPAYKRAVGILFQDDLLFPHLRVWENLAFALPNAIKGKDRKQQALNELENIHLSKLADNFPDELSGGQRARVSLLRMLMAKPKLVLLDEPFSKLDKALRSQFRDWVFEQIHQANVPALMVTHDLEDVHANSLVLSWPWSTK